MALLALIVLVAIVIVAVVLPVRRSRSARMVPISLVADLPPEDAIGRVAMVAGGVPAVSCNALSATSLQVSRNRTTLWAIIVAILLFPIGLLALIAKRQESAVLAAAAHGTGSSIRSSGPIDKRLRASLLASFSAAF